MDKSYYTLTELAEETGLSVRTIRYYISRGLLDGPVVAGRGAAYEKRHLDRLHEIQQLQAAGHMLAEIGAVNKQVEIPAPQTWWQYTVADGVVISVRSDLSPWHLKRIQKLIAEAAATFTKEENEDGSRNV